MSEPGSEAGFGDRWVVVSGASSGIGRATAVEVVRQGGRAVLLGRRREALDKTAALAGPADRTEVVEIDLAALDGIVPAVTGLAKRLGPLYGLFHAAGASKLSPLATTTPERLRTLMDLNLLAGLELTRALTRRDVLAPAGGSVVFVASVAAHVGAAGQTGYSATKGAVVAAVRSMAVELAPRKTRVNCLSPGVVESEMTSATAAQLGAEQWQRIVDRHPLGIGAPEDVARAAVFLLHPANRWITGVDWAVDGGYTVV